MESFNLPTQQTDFRNMHGYPFSYGNMNSNDCSYYDPFHGYSSKNNTTESSEWAQPMRQDGNLLFETPNSAQCSLYQFIDKTYYSSILKGSSDNGQHRYTMRPKRKRVATMAQRRAANIRERRRMFNLNEAFDLLRRKVPTFAYEKRLSRIETLRLAMTYINFMTQVVESKPETDSTKEDKDKNNGEENRRPTHGTVK